MENKGEIILYQSENGIGVSALLDFTEENVTKIAQNSIATIKIPYLPINEQKAIKQVWDGEIEKVN